MKNKTISSWIRASRPQTLPVSIAGVIAGIACGILSGGFNPLASLCCLLFAVGAQIASNFANEYFDFKKGLDKKGREGFRRGVTEGDISPRAMKLATYISLMLAAIPGCILIYWGGLWLIGIGVIIAIFALAYSAGPYPLSHHGLGDVAVVIFFGLVPVGFTAWLQTLSTHTLPIALTVGLGVGLLAANVLIVNNYRDADDDKSVGKKTTVVHFGRETMARCYMAFSLLGLILLCAPASRGNVWMLLPLLLIPKAALNYKYLISHTGASLNALLKATSLLLLTASIILLAEGILTIILPLLFLYK
ncbi:MAG: 1,4-dihydroxy-2-naphthoate octaprenyltransferase [Muribaculaceae bacterium]|nr:1,4-dihydroxy-2-naphthoate octaprenyltransferase [Muribaculaceae bacterium]